MGIYLGNTNDPIIILEVLDLIEKYLDNKLNDLPSDVEKELSKLSKVKTPIKNKLNSICSTIKRRNEDELLIYGELMLVAEKMMKGDFSDKIFHTETSNIKLNYIANVINNLNYSFKENIDSALHILNEYSKYNYINKIESEKAFGDFNLLFEGINNLQKNITLMLIENKSNGLTLDESSDILLSNVNKLNKSSTDAAARLEETSAAVEEITANIRNNTDNITKMSSYSNGVVHSATNGNNLAQETTIAMDEINIQVNLINEAITVIDQIAFQTNILSLNAAVEAATAGEAGKGFTVVAQEVRNLASRSAEAAKGIKKIVENATIKANEGKDIAKNMISGYKELNIDITKTINLIQDIEMSSKEQLVGMEQINDAVNNLDQQTQQNAIVATEAHTVAVLTDKIAKLVVSNANSKEFVGKNNIQSKLNIEEMNQL